MTKTMIRVVSVILCLALLVAWSPMRAEAVMAETILLFGDDIIIAIVGCLIGLGIVANSTWYESTARDIYSDVQEEYISNPDNVIFHNFTQGPDPSDPLGLAVMQSVAMGSLMLAADVAEWIKGWLFDNEVLVENTGVMYHDIGFEFDVTSGNSYSAAYWESFDGYSLVNSGSPGVLVTNYSHNKYYGLVVSEDGQVDVGELLSLAPYTQATFPMGVFLDDLTFAVCPFYDAYELFNNYQNAYTYWLKNKKAVYFFKESSKLSMDNRAYFVGSTTVKDVGMIRADGSITSLTTFQIAAYSISSYVRNGLYPNSYTETTIVPEEGVELGQVAGKDEDLATGYPSWSQGAVENNGTTYYPIGSAPSIDSMASMNQEQIWSGTSFPEAPATGDDEDPGLVVLPDGWFSPILEFFEGLNTGEKNEALQGGQAGIDGVIDVIPDFSGEFVGALTDFSGVLGYEGTAAVLVVPPLTIPAVQNLVPEYQLIGEQRVDLEEYVAMVPEGLLLLIRSLLTLALIAYCPKEFYDTIEYIITLKGGKS